MTRSLLRVVVALGIATVGLTAGCSEGTSGRQIVDVYAASSLTDTFRELEGAFEATHAGTDIRLSFAGSQTLRFQIEQGAAPDVFASANEAHISALESAGAIHSRGVFAHNELVIIVPRDNPAGIHSFADLAQARRVVLGTREVPVGVYARRALARAAQTLGADFEQAVSAHVVSEETNVRLIRAKVELGAADAAIVYRTDVTPSALVIAIPVPPEFNVRASYPMAVLVRAALKPGPAAWLAFVRSKQGRSILERHGFTVDG